MKTPLVMVLLMAAGSAQALAPQTPMSFTLATACDTQQVCQDVILARGLFDTTTPTSFERFLLTAPATARTVYLDSTGGQVGAALEMGLTMRRRGLNAVVGGGPGSVCWSACPYAFLGGVRREVQNDGALGVHQMRARFAYTAQAGDMGVKAVEDEVKKYVQGLGGDPKVVDIAAKTPYEDMTVFTVAQARQLNLDNTAPAPTSWVWAQREEEEPGWEIHQQQAGSDQKVYLKIHPQRGRALNDDVVAVVAVTEPYGLAEKRLEQFAPAQFFALCRYQDGAAKACVRGKIQQEWRNDKNPRFFYSVLSLPRVDFTSLTQVASGPGDTLMISFHTTPEVQTFLGRLPAQNFNQVGMVLDKTP